jgi:hypothetical protein
MTGLIVRWLVFVLLPLLVACESQALPPDARPTIAAAMAATATAVARLPTPTPLPAPTAPAATRTPVPTSTRPAVVVSTPTPIIAVDVTEADYLAAWKAIRLEARASLNRLGTWYPWVGSNQVDHELAMLARANEYRLWQGFAPRLRQLNPPAKLQTLHGYNAAALDNLATAGRAFLIAESPHSDPFIAATGERTGTDAYAAYLAAIRQSEQELRDLGLEEIGPAA